MAPARLLEEHNFPGIPPFPTSVPLAPLHRISLSKLLEHDTEEENRLWQACCDIGFFYLDLRTGNVDAPDEVDTSQILRLVDNLFQLEESFFDLPLEEKIKYDFAERLKVHYGFVGPFLKWHYY